MSPTGAILCLVSAAAFGTMGVFGKLAYEGGASVGLVLAGRFALAAVLLWVMVLATRATRSALAAMARRDVALALGLGAVGYSAQAGAFFVALERIDASLLSLVVYTYPAMVTVAAVALGRDRWSPRAVAALVLASSGLVLVLAGATVGALDPLGIALGLVAAVVYSAYILMSEGVSSRTAPMALAAWVCTGAAITLGLVGLVTGALRPEAVTPAAFGWIAAIACVSTAGAMALFFAGLPRVGPTATAILSTADPFTAVVLAVAVFGESLGPLQAAGGALVVSAVVVLSVPARPVLRRRLARQPA